IPATPTAAQSGGPQSSPPTTRNRRKPEPKLKHNWPLEVAVEVYRFREKEGRTPSASELAQFCYDKWEWAPDDSDINKLLKILLNDYWPLEVAVEVYRFREKEGRTPSASESAQFCYNKWEWAPDDSDINKLLKILLND